MDIYHGTLSDVEVTENYKGITLIITLDNSDVPLILTSYEPRKVMDMLDSQADKIKLGSRVSAIVWSEKDWIILPEGEEIKYHL